MGALMTGLIPGSFFTQEQWRGPLAPYVADLIKRPGGILLIAFDIDPTRRNYPRTSFAVFNKEEHTDLRACLVKCQKKRETTPSRPRA
jgi:hypothetical protein